MDNIIIGFVTLFVVLAAIVVQILAATMGEEIIKNYLGIEIDPGMIVGGIVADTIIAIVLGILWLIGDLVNTVL